jgi:hypothetical protein
LVECSLSVCVWVASGDSRVEAFRGMMRGMTHLGEFLLIVVVWGLAIVVLSEVAPAWSDLARFFAGMGVALIALWLSSAAIGRFVHQDG